MSIRIDADFAGGNILVDDVSETADAAELRVRPDLRDTAGDWFYWCFRVRGAAGRRLRVSFRAANRLGVRGPALSLDEGRTWRWLGAAAGAPEEEAFVCQVPDEAAEVRFAFCPPYTLADFDRFVAGLAADAAPGANLRREELCTSAAGRSVPLLRGGAAAEAPGRLLLTCRHHCCEAMASYELEGVLRYILTGGEAPAAALRARCQLLAVPFVDLDGVEAGDQGKNRRPRDHNRDYAGASLYPETAALRRRVPGWLAGGRGVTLDLHCPWIRGAQSQRIYLVGLEEPAVWAEQQRFAALLEEANDSPLPYRAAESLPFGVDWNTRKNYDQGMSCSRWAADQPPVRLAGTLELPYAAAGGGAVTPGTARAFGRCLGRALARYVLAAVG